MTKLTNKQMYLVNSIHRRFTKQQIKNSMDVWLPLVDGKVVIFGLHDECAYDLAKEFPRWLRKDIYDVIVDYTSTVTYVTIAIPTGDGVYITVCRSGSGALVVGDKRYTSVEAIRRHNSQVPGGLTSEELIGSSIKWVLQFAEVVHD